MNEEQIITALKDTNAVKYGEFELSNGGTSEYYIDKYCFETHAKSLDLISEYFIKKINDEKLAGVALGAVPLVTATSLKSGNDYVIIRKNKKDHGTNNLIEGNLKKDENVIVIEDITTTGQSALNAVQALRSEGASVQRVLVVVDRQQGAEKLLKEHSLELEPLLTADKLLSREK